MRGTIIPKREREREDAKQHEKLAFGLTWPEHDLRKWPAFIFLGQIVCLDEKEEEKTRPE